MEVKESDGLAMEMQMIRKQNLTSITRISALVLHIIEMLNGYECSQCLEKWKHRSMISINTALGLWIKGQLCFRERAYGHTSTFKIGVANSHAMWSSAKIYVSTDWSNDDFNTWASSVKSLTKIQLDQNQVIRLFSENQFLRALFSKLLSSLECFTCLNDTLVYL